MFKKRYGNPGGKIRADINQHPGDNGHDCLQQKFVFYRQSLALFFDLHQVVIDKPDAAESDGDQQYDPHKIVG